MRNISGGIFQIILIISFSVFLNCNGSTTGGSPASEMDDGLSSDYFIKSLTFSAGTLKYPFNSSDWINYLEVPNDTDSLTVTAKANDRWTKIYIGDELLINDTPSNPISLSVGSNTLKLKVLAEDGLEFIYTVFITKYSENYSYAGLSELAIDGINLLPVFDATGTNRSFSASTTESSIFLHATPAAASEGATVEVRVNSSKASDLSSISLAQGINILKIVSTAPDGKTTETYTINIIRQTQSADSSRLIFLSIAGGNFNETFSSSTIDYSINVTVSMNPVNLTAITESVNSSIRITVNDIDVSDPASITITSGLTSIIKIIVTAADNSSTTYTIAATSLQGSDNADLSALKVMTGTKSSRPLYPGTFTRDATYHNPDTSGFKSSITEYASVIYGFDSVSITATADDNTVKAIQFTADDTDVSSELVSGTGTAVIPLKYGLVTKIKITVLAGDSYSQKVYTVYTKLLNIDEFYWGIYAPSLDKSKSDNWEPKPNAGGNKTVSGKVSGSMKWSITLDPTSTIALTNYCDGKLGFRYNDGGFIAHGTQEAKLNSVTQKNGYNCTKPGTTFYVRTAEGEDVATLGYHIKVAGGDTVEASDSYTDITYMGQTNRQIFRISKPYPFNDSYNWNASWNDGQ